MAKNALQAQLLKAGLVDPKKAKQLNKQSQHAKRTGDLSDAEVKQALADAQLQKLQKDQQLNQEKQRLLEEKTLQANIVQMIKQHQLGQTSGDISYQFIDQSKVKKIYVQQKIYDQIVAGHIAIARLACCRCAMLVSSNCSRQAPCCALDRNGKRRCLGG
ncbi:MAG: DUF2058 domain-containing protein, partial [Moraxellaceae bacterium]